MSAIAAASNAAITNAIVQAADSDDEMSTKVQILTDFTYAGVIAVFLAGLICYFDDNIPVMAKDIILVCLPLMAFSMIASVILLIENNEKKKDINEK